ncbi:MAG: DUF4254 domain-containing protein [Leptospira sp.]|nr:DUF4254 domain-containing protein [Leptospira sp.]
MNLSGNYINSVFQESIQDWHKQEEESANPHPENSLPHLLYKKCQIDTIQWHVEDEIRRPDQPDNKVVGFKRKIDKLNQERTDTVEILDDYFLNLFRDVVRKPGARLNSETPAWLVDRMSILELKIFHMTEQTERKDASPSHINACQNKLSILLEQRSDLAKCFDELLEDIQNGTKFVKVYRQMKMYNDSSLNPSLYSKPKT